MTMLNTWKPVYIILGVVLLSTAVLTCLDQKVAIKMIKDDGLIQIMTIFVLWGSVILAVGQVIVRTPPVLKWAETAFIIAVYCMREMDFHRLFTAEHVTRLKLYTGPYPLEEKLIGGTVMLAFIFIMAHFIASNARPFFKDLENKVPRAWCIGIWGMLLVGAQIIDKPKILRGIGPIKNYLEESMELGAAVLMIFILLAFSPLLKKLFARSQQTPAERVS